MKDIKYEWKTEEERNNLIVKLSNEYNAPTIAKKLGVAKKTVYRTQKLLGINSHFRHGSCTFSEEQELEMANLYNCNTPTGEIAKKFNTDNDSVIRACRRHKCVVRTGRESLRLSVRSDAYTQFSKIDPHISYILGLICSDGNIYRGTMTIGLKSTDIKLLEDIQKHLGLGSIGTVCSRTNGNKFYLSRFRICRSQIINDLKDHGVLDFKSGNPNLMTKLNDELFKIFIGGFFDGDGILCKTARKCGFVGIHGILTYIQNRINKLLDIELRLYEHGSIYRLQTADKNSMLKLLRWLYPQNRPFALERKKVLAEKRMSELQSS